MRNFNDYRAKLKGSVRWVYGTPMLVGDKFYIIRILSSSWSNDTKQIDHAVFKRSEVDEKTIGQCSGILIGEWIKPSKLYEGDVITDGKRNGVLLWDEENARFETFSTVNLKLPVLMNQVWADIKYVGNIYDNPELLEKKHA